MGNLFGFVTPDFANSRLGIGTDAPAVTFHVKGSSNQVARFENDNGALRIVNVSVSDNFGSGNRSVLGDHSQDVLVTTTTGGGTPNNSFILLNHDGNIRISAGASPGASEGITVLDGGNVSFSGNVSGSATSTGSFGAIRSIGLPLSVDSDHVGIGTTTPGSYYNSPLVTFAPSTNYLTIATNTNGISSILMADGTSGAQAYAAQLEYQHATDEWRFHGGGSRFMTVINSNVGIGDTNPGEKLSVTGNIKASANIQVVIYL